MMRKKCLFLLLAVLVLFTFQSCSSKPEQGLLKRYFNAVALNDNATMSSMAIEPITVDVASFEITKVTEEKIEPASLPEMSKTEAESQKKLQDHVGPTIDAKDALDIAKEDLDLARTASAKAAAKKKVEEMQAKYDQEYNLHRELQKNYNDAKAAAAREEEITSFSLGARSLANIRDLTGNVHSKEVEVTIKTKSGQEKKYLLYLRQYLLKDEASNLKHNGRWIIVKFEPIG
jgi:hypothetical protein